MGQRISTVQWGGSKLWVRESTRGGSEVIQFISYLPQSINNTVTDHSDLDVTHLQLTE